MTPPRMNFGAALSCLRKGEAVARESWRGEITYLKIIKEWNIPYTDDVVYPPAPFIAAFTRSDRLIPWIPAHTDILAGDWLIYEMGTIPGPFYGA